MFKNCYAIFHKRFFLILVQEFLLLSVFTTHLSTLKYCELNTNTLIMHADLNIKDFFVKKKSALLFNTKSI